MEDAIVGAQKQNQLTFVGENDYFFSLSEEEGFCLLFKQKGIQWVVSSVAWPAISLGFLFACIGGLTRPVFGLPTSHWTGFFHVEALLDIFC